MRLMPSQTAGLGIYYPLQADPIDVAEDDRLQAESIEGAIKYRYFPTRADRDAQWPNPPTGALSWTGDMIRPITGGTGPGLWRWNSVNDQWDPLIAIDNDGDVRLIGGENALDAVVFEAQQVRAYGNTQVLLETTAGGGDIDLVSADRIDMTAVNGIAVTAGTDGSGDITVDTQSDMHVTAGSKFTLDTTTDDIIFRCETLLAPNDPEWGSRIWMDASSRRVYVDARKDILLRSNIEAEADGEQTLKLNEDGTIELLARGSIELKPDRDQDGSGFIRDQFNRSIVRATRDDNTSKGLHTQNATVNNGNEVIPFTHEFESGTTPHVVATIASDEGKAVTVSAEDADHNSVRIRLWNADDDTPHTGTTTVALFAFGRLKDSP